MKENNKDEKKVMAQYRRWVPLWRVNLPFWVLSFAVRHWRAELLLLLMALFAHLAWSAFRQGTRIGDMRALIEKTGDAELLRRYDEIKDATARKVWSIPCKAYEKRYGKGAWVSHFKHDNAGTAVAYLDIAELAVGLSSAEDRDAFLDAHAAIYETCVRTGNMDLALGYGRLLEELRGKGGKAWQVAERNPFALCVYEAVKGDQKLWDWYLDNATWCDPFLMAIEPELPPEGAKAGDSGLADVVAAVRDQAPLLKRFAEEIEALSDEEEKSIADGDNLSECRESLFASSLLFVGSYHNVLAPMLEPRSSVSMLEAMAVVANNYTAFGLAEDGVLDSPDRSRDVALKFLRIHDERRTLWDFATGERGIGAIAFCEKVGNDAWCEQVIGMFGEAEVVPFLEKYYGETPKLLRVATETLCRCQEEGWAVLQEYRENPQVKALLQRDRIGYRLVPYYLKKGHEGFSTLSGDERWIDELLDKNGNLKHQNVSWYEMSPIGGDLATVIKKWAQDRPVTAGELGWAALDVADTAAMAFSFGMAKAASTGAKTAVKVTVKKISKRVARNIARKMMPSLAKTTVIRTARRTVESSGKSVVKAGARKLSFLKKVNKWFDRIPSVNFNGMRSLSVMKKPTTLTDPWHAMRKMDRKSWENGYRGCKTLMWCRYFGHTVPAKGVDFAYGVLEEAGEFTGRTLNALAAGAGDGLKAAVRETLGLPKGGGCDRLIYLFLAAGVSVLMVGMILWPGKGRGTTCAN